MTIAAASFILDGAVLIVAGSGIIVAGSSLFVFSETEDTTDVFSFLMGSSPT